MRAAAVLSCLLLAASASGGRAAASFNTGFGPVSVFAAVGRPGHADTSYRLPDGTVAVTTNRGVSGSSGPSKVFRYSDTGRLLRTYTLTGQNLAGDHGAMGMATDAAGRLYVADYSPPRILRLDLRTGRQQTWATIPDLPACGPAGGRDCDNGIGNSAPWPDGIAFEPDGRLLVTDLAQGTVFVVPRGGGPASVWLQGPQLHLVYGPNQLQLTHHHELLLDVTASLEPALLGRGVVYQLPIRADGSPGPLTEVFATQPGEGPDGFALGQSETIYLCTLVTDRVIAIRPDGTSSALQAVGGTAVFDSPSSATILPDGRLLVTNLTYFTSSTAHDLVLQVPVGDRPVEGYHPKVA